MNHRAFFSELRDHTGMYVAPERYDVVLAYVAGYNVATNALCGFEEWLLLKVGSGANLTWQGLADELVFGDGPRDELDADQERAAIHKLIALIDAFLAETASVIQLRELFRRFAAWEARHAPRPRRRAKRKPR